MAVNNDNDVRDEKICVDSGTQHHIFRTKRGLKNLERVRCVARAADGSTTDIYFRGFLDLGGERHVVYVNPNFSKNLLSVADLTNSGMYLCIFTKDKCFTIARKHVKFCGPRILQGLRHNNLYYFSFSSEFYRIIIIIIIISATTRNPFRPNPNNTTATTTVRPTRKYHNP